MAAPDRLVRHLSRCRTGRLPLRRRRALSRRSSGSRPAQPLQAPRPWLLVLTLHKTRMLVRYLTSGARQRARRHLPSMQRRIARFRHFFNWLDESLSKTDKEKALLPAAMMREVDERVRDWV
jgi:hypothetical protein